MIILANCHNSEKQENPLAATHSSLAGCSGLFFYFYFLFSCGFDCSDIGIAVATAIDKLLLRHKQILRATKLHNYRVRVGSHHALIRGFGDLA
jgi:hypothetical protein